MTSRLTVLFSAMFFWSLTETLFAIPQQEEAGVLSEEAVRLSDELAKNPPKPQKQLSDSELTALITEKELHVKGGLILGFEHVRQLMDSLSIVDVQITQIRELRTELESTVQKWENRGAEITADNTDPDTLKQLQREYVAELQSLVDECFAKIKKEVLLPHQQASFDAIYTQYLLLGLQTTTAGRAPWERVLRKFLNLTPQETAQLKEATEKASQELLETKEKARKKAANQVIAVLPEKKRPFLVELGFDNIEAFAGLLKSVKN